MFDGQKLGEDISGFVRNFMERELAPLKAANEALLSRVAELEARPAPEKGEPGDPGKDAEAPTLASIMEEFRPAAEAAIHEAVSVAIAGLPAPEPGLPGEPGQPGRDFDPEVLELAVGEAVAKAVEAIPAPKPGKDGRGIKELLIDRDGNLVATMDNGEMKSLGPVIGKDGAPGRDGRDGIDLDSFDAIVLDDDRTIELKFVSGEEERVASFKWPTMLDRGVFKAGQEYEAGDAVSWGGSIWVAQRATADKPDTPESGWRLAVKRGRDGKDKA